MPPKKWQKSSLAAAVRTLATKTGRGLWGRMIWLFRFIPLLLGWIGAPSAQGSPTVTFMCPHCHKPYRVAATAAGKSLTCRVCQSRMVVPPRGVPAPEVATLPSGGRVYRHRAPTRAPAMAEQGTPFYSQISRHIEKTIGPAPMVIHELFSPGIHLDLHIVPPTNLPPSPEHPFGTSHYTVVTSGVSSQPMNVPPGGRAPRFIELMIALPGDWPGLRLDGTCDWELMKDERSWWPLRWLGIVARMPVTLSTFVGLGHTIPNGEQADPFAANTRFGCLLVVPPLRSPQSARLVVSDHVAISFLALMPLYPEEMRLKLRSGAAVLHKLLDNAVLTELIDIRRRNVAGGT